jgi:hypothetical protein
MNNLRKQRILEKLAEVGYSSSGGMYTKKPPIASMEDPSVLRAKRGTGVWGQKLKDVTPLGGAKVTPKESLSKQTEGTGPKGVISKKVQESVVSANRRIKAEREGKGGYHDIQRRTSTPLHQTLRGHSPGSLGSAEDSKRNARLGADLKGIKYPKGG